ncbi:5-(carboxyamino)imidazole ribonucleotide synthase [Parvularcula flava]|uniref:N5-carboxyaminoimidazole ribonucleotide synthase n=1 Tax=Aquisalinus luteolus TaxID=1566827 RepID=A0A8J3A1J6_9PROT|nr:5-(carboxyamino)imidazole ribonucleotide synthase [Aquisalinus luteolus]NHK26730.1 5-(carboxyamino)imidazole ribonucleotide synthase [Aquisalinus luteolus]GGH93243.1 N5-carboxyaminoimidazole ribonucleotide synthase [Aquisalinus luteolus]
MSTTSAPLPPGSTIGILGGGQLGRMLAVAAAKLGFHVHIYCPDEKSPAAEVARDFTKAGYDDDAALERFAASVDVVTYEFENVPASAAEAIARTGTPLRPGARALEVSQDRLTEKKFLKDLGIDTAPFMPVASEAALGVATEVTGIPAILKTRRFGYDGKGQAVIHDEDEVAEAYASLKGAPAIMEGFVPFEREISVIAARELNGTMMAYDPAENVHRDGILRTSTVPAEISEETWDRATDIACDILTELDYVGVIGVEFFVEKSGHLRVNEMAPRVHNSGHWTVEACHVSQFEQHIRAIAGWSLADPVRHSDCVMENLIGKDVDDWQTIGSERDAYLTLYGKKEARNGRKMGHVTRLKPRS